MRISEEIDARGDGDQRDHVPVRHPAALRLLHIVPPFVYLGGIGWGFFASYLAVVHQVGGVSAGGY